MTNFESRIMKNSTVMRSKIIKDVCFMCRLISLLNIHDLSTEVLNDN